MSVDQAPVVLRDGPMHCTHPSVRDEQIIQYAEHRGPDSEPPYCAECRSWLYPHFDWDEDAWRLYDEPPGAGE